MRNGESGVGLSKDENLQVFVRWRDYGAAVILYGRHTHIYVGGDSSLAIYMQISQEIGETNGYRMLK